MMLDAFDGLFAGPRHSAGDGKRQNKRNQEKDNKDVGPYFVLGMLLKRKDVAHETPSWDCVLR